MKNLVKVGFGAHKSPKGWKGASVGSFNKHVGEASGRLRKFIGKIKV